MNTTSSIVLYDSKCGFCTKIANFLKKKDKKKSINWIENDSNKGIEIILSLKLEEHIDSIIYTDEKNYLIKSDAIVEILKILRCKIRFLIQLFPSKLNDFIYDKIAQNRYLFHKCTVR